MQTFLRILSFAKPLYRYIIPFTFFSLLAAFFGIINLALLIPLLDVLFGQVGAEELQQMMHKPTFSWSIDYLLSYFNYYFASYIIAYGKMGALYFVCGVIIISIFLSNVFKYLAQIVLEYIQSTTVAGLRAAVYHKLLNLDLGFFSNHKKGNIMSRLTTDVSEVEFSVAYAFRAALKDPIEFIIYLTVLFFISVKLTLFTFIVIPVSGVFIAILVKKLRKDSLEGQSSLGRMMSTLDETIGGIRIVQAFNALSFMKNKFDDENQYYKKIVRSMARKRELSSPFSEFIGVSIVAGITLYGGSLIISGGEGALKPAEFIGYIGIFSQFLRPAKEIANAFSKVQRGIVSGKRIFEVLDSSTAIENPPHPKPVHSFGESISFRNVDFSYEKNIPTLKDINFTLEKGKTLALVGPSGGGKSTIADLIPRFYDPDGGSVVMDGINIKHYDLENLRGLMGIVSQEAILFNDTIFNNIAFGINASHEEVIQAAKIANAHEFILQMEEGYQTIIGDRGVKLSGGQRQRISIARAVLKNPPILVLDEATSALDNNAEKLVQEAIEKLMKDRTVLIIAHRLSTIQNADHILVIQGGKIVEQGTHETLLQHKGAYYQLSLTQQEPA